MITVSVGDEEVDLERFNEGWVAEQLARRARDGGSTCVQVAVDAPGISMLLTTPECRSSGPYRSPNRHEKEIFDLWRSRGLSEVGWTIGGLMGFVKQVQRLL